MKTAQKCSLFLAIMIFCSIGLSAQTPLTEAEKRIFVDVEKRAEKYIDQREKFNGQLPQLSTDSTPEQIIAHKLSLRKLMQSARLSVKQGNVFTPAASRLIKRTIKAEFKGYERTELRQRVLDADTKGVALKINFVYPESKELVEMSPALLLSLPQLPEQLRYRFVGRSLVILDRDISLIIDFMQDALP